MPLADEGASIGGHISREICDKCFSLCGPWRLFLEIDVIQCDRGLLAGRDNSQPLAITATGRCSSGIPNRDGVLGVIVSVGGFSPKNRLSLASDQDVLIVRATLDEDGVPVTIAGKSLKGSGHSPVLTFGRVC